MRWRRWLLGAVLAAAALPVAGLLLARRSAAERLVERRQVLERLVAEARASRAEGEARLASGDWDLVAQVPSSVVERVLQEFVGYRQRTRRGNDFAVRTIATRFHDGYAELRATADFDWRLGLYHGPVEATYYAFARLGSDGGCDLFFRLAELRTLARWPLLNRFLEPILTYRMQRSLAIPNLRLPLGLAHTPEADAAWSRRFPSGLEVTVPGRPIGLGQRRALPLLDARRLGVVVERPASLPRPPAETLAAAAGGGEEVEVAARLDFIAERLAQAVEPESDFQIALERLDLLWSRRTKGGTEMRADLVNLRGTVDLRSLEVEVGAAGLELAAQVHAVFSGQVEGSVLRIRHAVPLRMTSTFTERLPLLIVAEHGALGLRTESGGMRIPLAVETRLRTLPVRFETALAVPGETLARAARLPALVLAEFTIPTRVVRGKVVESKRVPVEIEWRAEMPIDRTAPLRARGRVRLE